MMKLSCKKSVELIESVIELHPLKSAEVAQFKASLWKDTQKMYWYYYILKLLFHKTDDPFWNAV